MINCAVIGSGNIGTDLLYKLRRSEILNPVWMAGIDPDSEGLRIADSLGVKTTAKGVDALATSIESDDIKITFDATSAKAHVKNWETLKQKSVQLVDLTPAALGPFCVPSVNLDALLEDRSSNVNMVSCGGQATTPIVHAIRQICDVDYAEIVASMSSRSVGPGSRQNLDEVLQTTQKALEQVSGAVRAKVLVVVNPAEPPMLMRNTVSCLLRGPFDRNAVEQAIHDRAAEIGKYVPGYRVANGPIFDGQRVTVFLEVEGEGDFLPKYAGNLDIMTAAACRTGELIAEGLSQ